MGWLDFGDWGSALTNLVGGGDFGTVDLGFELGAGESARAERRRGYQQLVALIDDIGYTTAVVIANALGAAFHRETGRCVWCGRPAPLHDHAAREGREQCWQS